MIGVSAFMVILMALAPELRPTAGAARLQTLWTGWLDLRPGRLGAGAYRPHHHDGARRAAHDRFCDRTQEEA